MLYSHLVIYLSIYRIATCGIYGSHWVVFSSSHGWVVMMRALVCLYNHIMAPGFEPRWGHFVLVISNLSPSWLSQSMWTPDGLRVDSWWTPGGFFVDSSWTLYRLLVDSGWTSDGVFMDSWWTLCGLLMDSCWTPGGLLVDSGWTPGGLRLDSWWTVEGLHQESYSTCGSV